MQHQNVFNGMNRNFLIENSCKLINRLAKYLLIGIGMQLQTKNVHIAISQTLLLRRMAQTTYPNAKDAQLLASLYTQLRVFFFIVQTKIAGVLNALLSIAMRNVCCPFYSIYKRIIAHHKHHKRIVRYFNELVVVAFYKTIQLIACWPFYSCERNY